MKEKFPSLGNEVTITEEMCDLNGHMNVIYYAQIFEDEFPFYSNLGLTLITLRRVIHFLL